MLPNAKKLRSGLVLGLVLVLMLGVAFASPGGSSQPGGGFIQTQRPHASASWHLKFTGLQHGFTWLPSEGLLNILKAPF